MAAFPSLQPLERSYGMGAHVTGETVGQNGDGTRFLFSDLAADVPMQLQFRALTLTQAQLIRDHYSGQRGGVLPFAIPSSLYLTHSNPYDVVLPAMQWQYAGPPEETPLSGGLFDVSVSLSAVF